MLCFQPRSASGYSMWPWDLSSLGPCVSSLNSLKAHLHTIVCIWITRPRTDYGTVLCSLDVCSDRPKALHLLCRDLVVEIDTSISKHVEEMAVNFHRSWSDLLFPVWATESSMTIYCLSWSAQSQKAPFLILLARKWVQQGNEVQ
jgi:hypothetical protein